VAIRARIVAGGARLVEVEALLVVGSCRGSEDAHVARVPNILGRANDK
jgi:hypothetical protein